MKTPRILIRAALGLGLAMGVAACVGPQNGGSNAVAPLSGSWKVMTLGGMTLPAEANVSLAFAAPKVSGNAGCNGFSGSYSQTGNGLTFGPAAMTRKACAPQLMDIETGFSTALTSITRFDLGADGILKLYVGDSLIMQAQRG